MKTKRVGYLRKATQAKKTNQPQALTSAVKAVNLEEEGKALQDECNGVCAIAWKPATAVAQ